MKLKRLFKTVVSYKAFKAILAVGLVGVTGVVAAQTNVPTEVLDSSDFLTKVIASALILGGLLLGFRRQSMLILLLGISTGLVVALFPAIINIVFDAVMHFIA